MAERTQHRAAGRGFECLSNSVTIERDRVAARGGAPSVPTVYATLNLPADGFSCGAPRHAAMLRYDGLLRDGLPIATGVIEGSCHELMKYRMHIMGAPWAPWRCRGDPPLPVARSLRRPRPVLGAPPRARIRSKPRFTRR